MKNAISSGFRQTANVWMFFVPILTAAIIMMNFVDPVIRTYRESGFFRAGFHVELWQDGFRPDSLASFLPILAAALWTN